MNFYRRFFPTENFVDKAKEKAVSQENKQGNNQIKEKEKVDFIYEIN